MQLKITLTSEPGYSSLEAALTLGDVVAALKRLGWREETPAPAIAVAGGKIRVSARMRPAVFVGGGDAA